MNMEVRLILIPIHHEDTLMYIDLWVRVGFDD